MSSVHVESHHTISSPHIVCLFIDVRNQIRGQKLHATVESVDIWHIPVMLFRLENIHEELKTNNIRTCQKWFCIH